MANTQTSEERPERPVSERRKPWRTYLLVVLLLPSLLASSAFFVVTRPSYGHWSTSRWGAELDYPFNMPRQDADVVIFGDSSAFLGIAPKLVDAQLGTRSVVLPATVGSLPVVDDRTLELYLAHNPRPRLIVFYFAAWNLDYRRTAKAGLFEGEELLLRRMSRHDLVQFSRRKPAELLKFPLRFYNTLSFKRITDALAQTDREQTVANDFGHVDYNEPKPPLESPCILPKDDLTDAASDSVQDLLRRYRQTGIPVLVYIAPVPACTNASVVTERSYAAVAAAPPHALPSADFASDPYYAHMRPASVPLASSLLADAIRVRLQQDTPH